MTRLRHWLIAAAFLSATHSSGLAAEPLEGARAPVPASNREDPEPAGPGRIPGNAAGGRLGSRDAVLASHALQPLNRLEFGLGLRNDALANGFSGWYGVYLQGLDRVAERNTVYGLLRDAPHSGLIDGKAPPAGCCQRGIPPTSIEQFASTIAAREVSPTIFLFGMLRKKGLNFNLDDGWKLQAGVRHMQYSGALRTKVGFVTVEHQWESFRSSYSYQLERAGGASVAPSHVLQFDYLYGPRDSIGISLADGRELADFGPLGILNTEARSVAVRGQHWFKQDWALTFQAGYNDHGNMPAQRGIRVGLRNSF